MIIDQHVAEPPSWLFVTSIHSGHQAFILFAWYPYLNGEGSGTHSSTLAWKIPWMEEPGRLQSMGSL